MKTQLMAGAAFGLILGAMAPAQSFAQDQSDGVSDIVVTASKRTERLVDTPQTVNVVTGDEISKLAVVQFEDVTKIVPGLQISSGDGRQQSVSLRGVTFDPDAQTSSTVDVYFNEVVINPQQALTALFDIGGIQVLRGPQGTLRAGTGPSGAILINSRRPNLNRAEVNVTGSFTDRNAGNISGGVSIPLIKDILAVRVAGLYDENDGLRLRNVNNGEKSHNRTWAGRVTALFQPTDNLEFQLMHQRLRSRATNFIQVISDPTQPTGQFGQIGFDDLKAVQAGSNRFYTSGNLTIFNASWDFAGHRLSYEGGLQSNRFNTQRDLNIGAVNTPAFLDFVVPGLGNYPYQEYQRIDTTQKQFTNEFRFERTGNHFWIYRFGMFLSNLRAPFGGQIDYTGSDGSCSGRLSLLGLPCFPLGGGVTPRTVSRGYFTTQTLNFTDRDTLDVGARYSTSKTISANSSNFNAWTGTASFKHRFSEALLTYITAGTSYRPGGFDDTGSATASIPQSYFTFAAEKSKSVEIGAKGTILNNRLFYSLSGFYQQYDNFISRVNNIACTGSLTGTGPNANTIWNTTDGTPPNGGNSCSGSGFVNLTYNAPAIAKGIELELRGEILKAWNAGLTITYSDAKFANALIPCNDYLGNGTPNNATTPAVQRGQYFSLCKSSGGLSTAPKFQAAFNTDASFDLGRNNSAFVRGLAKYNGSASNPNTGVGTPAFLTIDAFAGVRTPFGVELSIFGRNLTDRVIRTDNGAAFGLFGDRSGYNAVVINKGREIGFQMRFDY